MNHNVAKMDQQNRRKHFCRPSGALVAPDAVLTYQTATAFERQLTTPASLHKSNSELPAIDKAVRFTNLIVRNPQADAQPASVLSARINARANAYGDLTQL